MSDLYTVVLSLSYIHTYRYGNGKSSSHVTKSEQKKSVKEGKHFNVVKVGVQSVLGACERGTPLFALSRCMNNSLRSPLS